MTRASGRRIAGGAVAVLLVVAVVVVAGPGRLLELLRTPRPAWLLPAAIAAVAALGCRGLRLSLLLEPGRLGVAHGALIAAAAQVAALFVPWRIGELALPLLLRRRAGTELASGVGTLLVTRSLDLMGLGAWAAVALLALGGSGRPGLLIAGLALLVPIVVLPVSLRVADGIAVRTLAVRGVRGRRWARRVRRTRLALRRLTRHPVRFVGAVAASLGMWGCLWGVSLFLLAAMDVRWPWWTVVAGSAAASVANLLPVNAVANLGTLEAGWTAGFTALGVPVEMAAATGLACHLWALVFAAGLGAIAWAVLSRSPRGSRGTEAAPGSP